MKEARHIIAGVLAAIALAGAILLAALERDTVQITALLGFASTFGAYALGLTSDMNQENE